jgi:hypothetical protein
MKISNKKLTFLASLSILFLMASSPLWLKLSSAAAVSGAIYTTDMDGMEVDLNLYNNKEDVYLNGGPHNTNASGLDVGTYWFQVTSPNGDTLLSTDPALCRQVVVTPNSGGNGVVSGAAPGRPAYCTDDTLYPVDGVLGFPADHNSGGQNANGGYGVQLMPFDTTPNNGGEYKVWLIRQTSQTTVAPDGRHINNVNGGNSKTDNFKIRFTPTGTPTPTPNQNVTYTLSGCKFYDANANGVQDPTESTIPGVRVVVTINGVEQPFIETGSDGCWSFPNVPFGAEYSVVEILPLTGEEPAHYWLQTAPAADGNGERKYSGIANGPFTCGGDPEACVGQIPDLDFGNLCFGPASGGLTLGYWSNKNGQKTMTNGMVDITTYPVSNSANSPAGDNPNPDGSGMNNDLAFLRRLNLINASLQKKTGNTLPFDPNSYQNFNTWLLNGNAVNMAYMLSVQLSATSLDVRHKSLFDNQIVDATGLGLGLITIGSVRVSANEELIYVNPNDPTITGANTYTGNPLRDDEEILKNFLDAVNNNRLSFAQTSACTVTYPPPPTPTP